MDLRRSAGYLLQVQMRDDGNLGRGVAGGVGGSCHCHQILSRQNQQTWSCIGSRGEGRDEFPGLCNGMCGR